MAGALALGCASGVLLSSAAAGAHVGHIIQRAERYLKLDVSGCHARVVVSLTLGAGEGGRVLAAADGDGDGVVSERESQVYLRQWADGLAGELPVTVDGERADMVWGEGYFDPVGSVRASPVTVELVGRSELRGGEQTVVVADRMVRRGVFDRTDVSFRTRDGAELLASGMEPDPAEPTPDLAYGPDLRPGEPVLLKAVVRTPERESSPAASVAGAVAAACLLIVLTLVLRARRRRG